MISPSPLPLFGQYASKGWASPEELKDVEGGSEDKGYEWALGKASDSSGGAPQSRSRTPPVVAPVSCQGILREDIEGH